MICLSKCGGSPPHDYMHMNFCIVLHQFITKYQTNVESPHRPDLPLFYCKSGVFAQKDHHMVSMVGTAASFVPSIYASPAGSSLPGRQCTIHYKL